jgi:hypothetical protein
MRLRFQAPHRPARPRQRFLPARDRAERFASRARWVIATATTLIVAAALAGTIPGRYLALAVASRARAASLAMLGRDVGRPELDAFWNLRRHWDIDRTRDLFRKIEHASTPEFREFLRVADMTPENGLLRWGNYDRTILLSPHVFEADERRSYRFRPGVRSIWLRNMPMPENSFGLFLVPDTAEIRRAALATGAEIVEGSTQLTNSWGCRGPEPDLDAPVRGLVLGDSFMQGMFLGDHQTPPECLRRDLATVLGRHVSVLNTGHLGYSPEQYYHALLEYADRFRPHFLVVSVCPNDFGDGLAVLAGGGDWAEAGYWLGKILEYGRSRGIPVVVAPVPCDDQLERSRREGNYPGRVSDLCVQSASYCNPFDDFVNEHLRLVHDRARRGLPIGRSPLYNRRIDDGHFSALGAQVWGRCLARRVALMLEQDAAALSLD